MDKKIILTLTNLCLSYFIAFMATLFLWNLSGINLFIPFISIFIVAYIILMFVLKLYLWIKNDGQIKSKSIFYCSLGLLFLSICGTVSLLFIPAYIMTLDYYAIGYTISVFICLVMNIILDVSKIKTVAPLRSILSNLSIYIFIFL